MIVSAAGLHGKTFGKTSAEAAFIEEFFRDTWGYAADGTGGRRGRHFHALAEISDRQRWGRKVAQGAADLAIGFFRNDVKRPCFRRYSASLGISDSGSRCPLKKRKGTTDRPFANASTISATPRPRRVSHPIPSSRPGGS